MNLTFAAQLNKMITAGLGGAVEAPQTGVAVGRRIEYTSIGPAPILTFEANSELPLKALSINMEPIQEGSGDPSPENIRPISGRQSVTVTRAGKNLSSVNAVRTLGGDNERTATFVLNYPIPPGTYTVKANVSGTAQCGIQLLKPGVTLVNVQNANTATTITLTETAYSLYFYITQVDYDLGKTATVRDFQIEVGSTSTAYEPYTAQSVTIQLGQTVYGGTVDAVSGVMTVDRAMVTYDGSENWYTNAISGGVKYRMALDSLPIGIKTVTDNIEIPDIITNILPAISADESWRGIDGIAMQTTYGWRIYCEAFNTSDAAPWKAFLAEHPLTIVYKLAQPITITLTPEQLTTVLGTNNVWSDADEVSLTYGNIYYTEGY